MACHFYNTIEQKYGRKDEVRLLFDRCDLPMSLREATRKKRQGGQDPIYYRITDSTNISQTKHSSTSGDRVVSDFLLHRVVNVRRPTKKLDIYRATKKKRTQRSSFMSLMLHRMVQWRFHIHSPDTDVFVFALRRYPELCGNVSFVTGKGHSHRAIKLEPIVQALGETRKAALPAFHALSGADNTGCFSGHGKPLCWKSFLNVDEDVVREMTKLGTTLTPSEETIKAIEKFVCELYVPNTSLTSVKNL